MKCLKCGQQTKQDQVFCPDCLEQMERYPVKPDTPVILPQRRLKERKLTPKKQTKAEEMNAKLQDKVRRLWICVAILSALLLVVTGLYATQLMRQWENQEIGSNYSTYNTDPSTEPTKPEMFHVKQTNHIDFKNRVWYNGCI